MLKLIRRTMQKWIWQQDIHNLNSSSSCPNLDQWKETSRLIESLISIKPVKASKQGINPRSLPRCTKSTYLIEWINPLSKVMIHLRWFLYHLYQLRSKKLWWITLFKLVRYLTPKIKLRKLDSMVSFRDRTFWKLRNLYHLLTLNQSYQRRLIKRY
jgi:hypothetical protein